MQRWRPERLFALSEARCSADTGYSNHAANRIDRCGDSGIPKTCVSARCPTIPMPKVMECDLARCDASTPTDPSANPARVRTCRGTTHRGEASAITDARELTRVKNSSARYRPTSRELEDHFHPGARTSRQFANRTVTSPSRIHFLVRSVLCLCVFEGQSAIRISCGRRRRTRHRITQGFERFNSSYGFHTN